MLKHNPMRFGTAEFTFGRRALLIAKNPFDATEQSSVEGFTISGSQPAGSDRRIIFRIDGQLFKFDGSTLVEYTGAGAFADVIAQGNTVAELLALTDIPAFVGKKIYPIVALSAGVDSVAQPSIKIALKVRSTADLYEKNYDTPEYTLAAADGSTPRIADIVANVATTGNATCSITVKILDAEGNWSTYLPLADAKNREGSAVQFHIVERVTTFDGSDSVRLNSITIRHNMGATAVSGSTADIYSVVQNYETDLQTCYVVVKHKRLIDSQINAFVNFMAPPKRRELIYLGQSDGTRQQFALGVDGVKDTGIDQNTLRLFADGQPLTTFGYNVEISEVTVSTDAGRAITATYDYGHERENWLPMQQIIKSQPYEDGTYMSKFSYTLDDDDTAGKQISNVRLQLDRPTGRVENQHLGIATGFVQQFVLPHAAKQETIELNADWKYDVDTQIITVTAPRGTDLTISYDYVGEPIVVYNFVAGWSAAI